MTYPLHLVAYRGGRRPPEWVETREYETRADRAAAATALPLRWLRRLKSAKRVVALTVLPDGCRVGGIVGDWPERLGFVVGEDGRARRR